MTDNVFIFVPNLIGYARIILAFVAFYFMAENPLIFSLCYSTSVLLDEFDGHAARALNQCSKFGAMLDMLIDRCVATCLMVTLSELYPSYRIMFQLLISLDIGSHWIHMYSSMLKGNESHKVLDISTNFLLKVYYSSARFLTVMCLGNELFFCTLYWLNFSTGPTVITISNNPIGLWPLLAYLTFPISFLKQVINVLQLTAACQTIVSFDISERNGKERKRLWEENVRLNGPKKYPNIIQE